MRSNSHGNTREAEKLFRAAFKRLKDGVPSILELGTVVTQNNVAREAGRDPSALRKTRYPLLVQEIQDYVRLRPDSTNGRKQEKEATYRSISCENKLSQVRQERDHALSLLIEADRKILDLVAELDQFR